MQPGVFDPSAQSAGPASGVAGAHDTDALEPLPMALPPIEERAALPGGFRAGGTTTGIKPSGRPDLAMIATLGRRIEYAWLHLLGFPYGELG